MTINNKPETEEYQLGEETLSTSHIQEEITTCTVHEQGSKRGKPLLVSSDGFRYNVKKKQNNSVLWTCSSRSVTVPCYATVIQKGNDFVRGASDHKNYPEVSLNQKISIYMQVKTKANENVYESTTAIAKTARQDHIQLNEPGLLKTETLARIANRKRAKFRQANPSDLNFVLDQDFLNCQDFLVADISQNNARHLIFATAEQLQLLGNTR
ncbi:uncharacterized protein LOC128548302 [Mercenaria mercenaria]|uniref:uncharacterized protein LOC128548302 n=1 Tax=Mercenaria mercenaria TaxID=6596 RepID=UPI00234F3C9F|nr:uncharacterized protein LOC128548302 [Mercenaria mercenaria]